MTAGISHSHEIMLLLRFLHGVIVPLTLNHAVFKRSPFNGIHFVSCVVFDRRSAVQMKLVLHIVPASVTIVDRLRLTILD